MLKITTYATIVLSLALASCSNDFEPELPSWPEGCISFDTYVGNAHSRASVADASSLQSSANGFGIMAYYTGSNGYASATKPNFMYNQQAVYGSGVWNYYPLKYWPAGFDQKISFFAYAPYASAPASLNATESGITSLPTSDGVGDPVIKYAFGSDLAKHIDLLYASAKDKTSAGGKVNFEFRHALSRIGFKVCGWEDNGSGIDFDDNTTVTINALTFSTVRRGASLNLASGQWSDSFNGGVQAFTLAGRHLQNKSIKPIDGAKQINTEEGYMMIVPDNFITDQASKRYCVLVDYTVETIDPKLLSGKLVVRNKVYRYLSPNFEPGKAYTINIHLGMSGNSGSVDNGTDVAGPTPVDPNPEDPTVPSTGGKNSSVMFTTSVSEWIDNEDMIEDYRELPIFTFEFDNFYLSGRFYYESGKSTGSYTIKSLVSEDGNTNVLKRQSTFSTTYFSFDPSDVNFALIDPDKSYVLTLADENGKEWTADFIPNISVMDFTLDIKESNTRFVLPLGLGTSPASNLVVWDDESQDPPFYYLWTYNNYHTYSTTGLKKVRIFSSRRDTSMLQITEFNWNKYASDCLSLLYSMDTPILNSGMDTFDSNFKNCTNLTSISPDLFIYNTNAATFSETFFNCSKLQSIPAELFAKCKSLASMKYDFYGCTSVKSIPGSLFDNCPMLSSMVGVFLECTNITAIPSGIFKNNSLLTDINNIFARSGIERIPAGIFLNCPKIENMEAAFSNCYNLTTVEAGAFDGLVGVTSYASLFTNCRSLKSIPSRLFSSSTKAKSFFNVFYSCSALQSIPGDIFANCSAAESFNGAFHFCTSLAEIPESLFSSSTAATNFGDTFRNCSSIKSIPAGLFSNNSMAYTMSRTFMYCTSLNSVPSTLFDSCFPQSKASESSCVSIFEGCQAITSAVPELWKRTTIGSYSSAFSGCVRASNYESIPSGWK